MAKFTFRLPSEGDIRNSRNGGTMLHIIESDYKEKFTVVTGCPGSGKTTVSIFRLIRLVNNRKPTVLLTYQTMLKVAIENLLVDQGIPKYKVNTMHSWYWSVTKKMLGFSHHGDKLNSDQIEKDLKNKNLGQCELILDEAQDLEERIFQSLPNVFGRITIGADNDQQMHPNTGASEHTIKKHLEHSLNEFELQFNYRNTYHIYNFARYFVPDSPKVNDANTLSELQRYKNNGDKPEVLKFNSQKEMRDRLKIIIDNYKSGFNIGILFPYVNQVKEYYDIVQELIGDECSMYHSEMTKDQKGKVEEELKNILITTFISAKGMEFDVVIMPEFDSVKAGDKKQFYVGCTRAKNRLVLMHTGNKPAVLNNFPTDTYDTGNLF